MRTIAIVGATGVVGREFAEVLARRRFPAQRVRLFSSGRSAGRQLEVMGQACVVEDVESADLRGVDLAFFSAGAAASLRHAPRFAQAGAHVVDNSSAFRQEQDVPLVVPEINGDELASSESRIVANPNCSTIILLMPLAPLHRCFGVHRVIVSTYQAISGAGRAAQEELEAQVRADAAGEPPPLQVYDRPIHLNLFPQIGELDESGFCLEESKVLRESRRILSAPDMEIVPTTVRVPVLRCHSESVHVQLARPATRADILAAWAAMPGLRFYPDGDPARWPTPRELAGDHDTHVGRLRPDPFRGDSWLFWVVSDQLLKGAALNAVQIGERLVALGRC